MLAGPPPQQQQQQPQLPKNPRNPPIPIMFCHERIANVLPTTLKLYPRSVPTNSHTTCHAGTMPHQSPVTMWTNPYIFASLNAHNKISNKESVRETAVDESGQTSVDPFWVAATDSLLVGEFLYFGLYFMEGDEVRFS